MEGRGEEGEEPVEGDEADLNVVEGEHLVKGRQVRCHLTRLKHWGEVGRKALVIPKNGEPFDQPGRPRGWPSSMRQGVDPEKNQWRLIGKFCKDRS